MVKMTKEEFLKKNNWYCEEKFSKMTGKIKVVKMYFNNGDTVKKGDKIFDFNSSDRTNSPFTADANGQIKYCFKSVPVEMDSSEIFAVVENTKMSRLWDVKSAEYEKLVEEHRKTGDLIDWWLKERDENADIYFIIDALATESEISDYKDSLYPHIEALIEDHKEKGDFEEWVFDCKKKDNSRYLGILGRESACKFLKEKYSKEVSGHRAKGDLIDYLWELCDDLELNINSLTYDWDITDSMKQNWPFEYKILRSLYTSAEREEFALFRDIMESFGRASEDCITLDYTDQFKYIFKLYQTPKNSIEHKRYEKIRSRITTAEILKQHDSSIKKTKLKKSLIKYGSIVGVALVLILIGTLFIRRTATKDARLAKQEAQRIEKIKLKDFAQLEKLGSTKLKLQDILVSTSEPSMYVIASMSYDTVKFINDNSNVKGLLGSSDKSAERLTLLESCITDFQSKIDTKLGVSFLDRTKIAQIENEHKFQLGDWSNDKKTAEVGKALNANVMLFLDKFGYINDTDEIRFEAKFVDINTMRSTQYNLVYKKPAKKITTPEIVNAITFKDFSGISTKKNPFEDEISLKVQNKVRTSQKIENKEVSPLGSIQKIDFSEYDVYSPKSSLLEISSITFDGFGSAELQNGETIVNATYTFEPIELKIEEIENGYYSDGKIGTLILKIDSEEEKCDVFTQNNKEYFIKIGSAKPDSIFINYYLQTIKQ